MAKDSPSPQTVRLLENFPDKARVRIHSFWNTDISRFVRLESGTGMDLGILKLSKYWPRVSDRYGNDLWWPFRFLLKYEPNLRKRETGLFSVETMAEFEEAKRLGVNYITTDNVDLCREKLAAGK